MKRKLEAVLEKMNQTELAAIMGCYPSRISQILSGEQDAFVHYEDGNIAEIRYSRDVVIRRKND